MTLVINAKAIEETTTTALCARVSECKNYYNIHHHHQTNDCAACNALAFYCNYSRLNVFGA